MVKPLIAFALLLLLPASRAGATDPIPAFTPNARILFQGDSITDMNRGRTADPNHILGHSYVFILTAPQKQQFETMKGAAFKFPERRRPGQ